MATALVMSQPVVRIPKDAVLPEPLTLDSQTTELILESNAQAIVIDRLGSEALKVHLGENARLTHYRLFLQDHRVNVQSQLTVNQERSSVFTSHVLLLGAADVVNQIDVLLNGEAAECHLNGLYLATGNQQLENRTLIDHARPSGISRELYKGILDDQAHALFEGLVIVRAEAQKTDSSQTNKNLLLSAKAKASSNPELKILANDVKCKHGATIGQMDPSQLFYMQSRGIPIEEARKLLIHGFASEMIEQIGVESLRKELSTLMFDKFQK